VALPYGGKDDTDVLTTPTTGRCTCEVPSEHNDPDRPGYDRHEVDCALASDLTDWLWYEHDGEFEGGGVYVHPTDRSCIYLLIDNYLCRVPLYDDDEYAARRYVLRTKPK
jgi:hypothetical protein